MADSERYLDPSYSPEERAADLVSRMTLEEKASQMRYDAPAVERLGIPAYNWWNEALHGVARAGTATMFPQAIGLAAMFDDGFLGEIADIISTEGRAKYNEASRNGDRDIYKGLTFWSPNINIFRDPRWGRGHETYGEDPYLTSRLGVAFVKGLQGDGKYLKAAACAKHYAVHSGPEGLRHSFDAEASPKDMWETYLPAFEACVKEAKVESVMGAYNRTNGEPCCGSKTLLKDILRDKWGFQGHVVSDCWAIADFHNHHMVTHTAPESAALAVKNGCDLNCGNTYLHVLQAYQEGLITEDQITAAVTRLMATRIRLGLFDEDCPYHQIPYEVNDCPAHSRISLEASERSMVLLKNSGILPINREKIKSIAVIGPNADSQEVLKGNYCGTASRYTTLLEGIQTEAGEDIRVYYAQGCHLYKKKVENLAMENDRITEAVSVAKQGDIVILCLGLDATLEGEQGDTGNMDASGDKKDLNLPGYQQELLEAVTAAGKPVVLLLSTGSALAIGWAQEHVDAILETWYCGSRGGQAAAEILFGKRAPSGRLPVTFYQTTEELPSFTDYSMDNRTYRYMKGMPLYPFGYGLTYGEIAYSNLRITEKPCRGEDVHLTVDVENKGKYLVHEAVQGYLKDGESPHAPRNGSLCVFRNITLQPGEKQTVGLTVKADRFLVVNGEGERVPGGQNVTVYVGGSQPDQRSRELLGKQPLEIQLKF